jgi:hypothetical protein
VLPRGKHTVPELKLRQVVRDLTLSLVIKNAKPLGGFAPLESYFSNS